MFDRERHATTPISWLHVAGFVIVLWVASSDVLAQVREVVVTEVRGNAVRANGSAAPVRALDTLKAGDRIRLSSDSHIGVFSAADAQLYVVDGPAEVAVGPKGVTANGKPAVARQLHDAYRNVKANSPGLVQGSLVMRGAAEVRVLAPEGIVDGGSARRFTWSQATGPWRFELATDAGEVIHRAEANDGSLTLPADVQLRTGTKYVWGILPATGGAAPGDWTEFAIVETASGPAQGSTPSERLVHAAWLTSRGLPRAAARLALPATR